MTRPAARRRPARRARLALGLLALCVGCGRCDRSRVEAPVPPLPAEALVPRTAGVVLGAPSLPRLAAALRSLERLQAVNAGARLLLFNNAPEFFGGLLERVGVDLRSAEAVAAAGLGGEASVALFAEGDDGHCLVAPLADAARFERFVTELAATRFGAEHRAATAASGAALWSFAPAAGAAPTVGALLRGANAVLCLGGAATALHRIAALGPADGLAASEGYVAAARRQADPAEGLWAYLPSLAPLVPRAPLVDARLALVATDGLLGLGLDARWTGPPSGLAALTASPALDLGALMPGEAVLNLRSTGDPRVFAVLFDALWPAVGLELRDDGLALDADVLGQLEPGLSVAWSLNRSPSVWELTQTDPRSGNPFKYFEPSFAAPLRDAADAGAVLERVVSVAPRFGVQVAREADGRGPVYRTTTLRGEGLSAALRGRLLLAGAPAKRLGDLLVVAEHEEVPLRAEAPAIEATMDLARLRVLVRSFAEEAPGVRRWAMRNTWHHWAGALSDLGAARLTLSATDDIVSGRLTIDVVRPKPRSGSPEPSP